VGALGASSVETIRGAADTSGTAVITVASRAHAAISLFNIITIRSYKRSGGLGPEGRGVWPL
jgi:hypothetical protein